MAVRERNRRPSRPSVPGPVREVGADARPGGVRRRRPPGFAAEALYRSGRWAAPTSKTRSAGASTAPGSPVAHPGDVGEGLLVAGQAEVVAGQVGDAFGFHLDASAATGGGFAVLVHFDVGGFFPALPITGVYPPSPNRTTALRRPNNPDLPGKFPALVWGPTPLCLGNRQGDKYGEGAVDPLPKGGPHENPDPLP